MKNRHTVLLIEDNEDDAELASRAIRRGSALNEIVRLRDGIEALDYLLGTGTADTTDRRASIMPALILLDLKMPKIGGLALLRRLRAEELTRRIPIVILTGSHEERDVVATHDLGANRFIVKPVTFDKLAAAAGQLGLHHLVGDVPPDR